MNKKLILGIAIAIIVIAAGISGFYYAAPKPAEMDKVRIGCLRGTVGSIFYIAEVKGYFREERIAPDFKYFEAAAPITTALAAGEIDVGATGITAATYNSIALGARIYLVADAASFGPGIGNALIVRKDLYDAGTIKAISDLKGKKIGITTLGSTFHYMLGKALELNKIDLNEVEIVPLKDKPILLSALKEKRVDAIVMTPYEAPMTEMEGYGKIILNFGDVIKYQVCALMYSEKMVKNEDLALRFMRAYLKALRYQRAAILEKKNWDEVVRLISDWAKIPKDAVEKGFFNLDPNGRLDLEDLLAQQKWYQKQGFVTEVTPLRIFVDTRFVEQAVKELGEIKK
jgi:NitT/TauT family transport system substrate-binding protein